MTAGARRVGSRVPTGSVEAIRALRMVRKSATRDRTSAINQMRSLIVTAPDDLREAFREVSIAKLVNGAARLRPADATTVEGATESASRELARRVQSLNAEIKRVNDVLGALVTTNAPSLVARLHSEASFAHLSGVAREVYCDLDPIKEAIDKQ